MSCPAFRVRLAKADASPFVPVLDSFARATTVTLCTIDVVVGEDVDAGRRLLMGRAMGDGLRR